MGTALVRTVPGRLKRKMPPYLKYKLQQAVILGFAFLLAFAAIRLAPIAHLNQKISDEIPLLALFTGTVFGCFIWESRPWWRRRSFWAFTVLMTLMHLLALLNLLLRRSLNPQNGPS